MVHPTFASAFFQQTAFSRREKYVGRAEGALQQDTLDTIMKGSKSLAPIACFVHLRKNTLFVPVSCFQHLICISVSKVRHTE